MRKNMSVAEGFGRSLAGIIIILLLLLQIVTGTVATVLAILACVLVLTGFTRFCPVYRLLNIDTNKRKRL